MRLTVKKLAGKMPAPSSFPKLLSFGEKESLGARREEVWCESGCEVGCILLGTAWLGFQRMSFENEENRAMR